MQPADDSRALSNVGGNVRLLRRRSGLSQTDLADRAGISRRTIINLEAGEANISLRGLDRLADALGTTFVALVTNPETVEADPAAVRPDLDVVAWRGGHADSVAVLLASVPAAVEAQLWTWSLGPNERYRAEPDPEGFSEMILVTEGSLRIEFDGRAVSIGTGEHIAFPSSQHYSYVNPGDARVSFTRIVVS